MEEKEERTARPLTREQAMRLLRGVPMGRIAFTHQAMPAIRPVNHVVDDTGRIIIRSHEGAAIVAVSDASRGTVVSYEADHIDADARTGWSVIATGLARVIDDPEEILAYQAMLNPWVTGETDYVIRIEPSIITAFELTEHHG